MLAKRAIAVEEGQQSRDRIEVSQIVVRSTAQAQPSDSPAQIRSFFPKIPTFRPFFGNCGKISEDPSSLRSIGRAPLDTAF
ncbi:MAG: hypothetical protein RQ826_15010 [Xanthomonadales bacterium]|nr:hypothetical protein [Xanthomonadales bacterium]